MILGKPRGTQRYRPLGCVEVTTERIYAVLKQSVEDTLYRRSNGEQVRLLAEWHFDVRRSASDFEHSLRAL